eukprot:SAG31_NODE_3008_length_4790_cov_327.591132_2_plen_101_part_00
MPVWPISALTAATELPPETEQQQNAEEMPPAPEPTAPGSTPEQLSAPCLAQLSTTTAEMQRKVIVGSICRVVSAAAVTRELEVNDRSRVVSSLQVEATIL